LHRSLNFLLGLQYNFAPKVIKKGIKRPADNDAYVPEKKKAKRASALVDLENLGSIGGVRRLSARIRGQVLTTVPALNVALAWEYFSDLYCVSLLI
jgi:hypothetical protein